MGKFWKWLLGLGAVGAVSYEVYDHFREEPKTMVPTLPMTKDSFLQAFYDAMGTQISKPGRKLAAAWSAFETNWGKTTGFLKGNNPFNITAGSHWTGDVVPGPDTEVSSDGSVKKITQAWRSWPTLADGIGGSVTFLATGGPHYSAGLAKLMAGDIGFVDEIRAGGFFTLQLDKYKAGVQAALDYANSASPQPSSLS